MHKLKICITSILFVFILSACQTPKVTPPKKDSVDISKTEQKNNQDNLKDKNKAQKDDEQKSAWQCRQSFGKKVCGYECMQSLDGQVQCTKFKDDHCVKNRIGEVACGLNCKVEANQDIVCEDKRASKVSTKRAWQCHLVFGKKTCGYHCLRNARGIVRCAKYFGDSCEQDILGVIKCGKNCKIGKDKKVTCEVERYSKQ